MGGERYYSFVKKNVRFFVLDSNQLDPQQRSWIDDTLKRSGTSGKSATSTIRSTRTPAVMAPMCRCASPRTAADQLRRQRRVRGTRPRLRTADAAEGHRALRRRVGGQLRRGDMRPSATDGGVLRPGPGVHARRGRRRRTVFPGRRPTGATVDSGVIQRRPMTEGAR